MNYIQYKTVDVIIGIIAHPCPNINHSLAVIAVWTRMYNYTQYKSIDMIMYPYADVRKSMSVKWTGQ